MDININLVIHPEVSPFIEEELAATILRMQEKAIWISSFGTLVNRDGQESYLYPFTTEFKYGRYDNDVISWSNPTGMYVIPYMYDDFYVYLSNAGYSQGLYVPFTNGEYPIEFREKWALLLAEQQYTHMCTVRSFFASYSNNKGLTAIPSCIMKYLMELPIRGIIYSHRGENKKYTPVSIGKNTFTTEYLGTYWTKGHIVIIVDYIGRTFVGLFSEDVHESLKRCGYSPKEQEVPFVKETSFEDEWYENRWLSLIHDCEAKA